MQVMKAGSPSLDFERSSKSVQLTRPSGVSRQSSNQLVGQLVGGSGNQADMEHESEGGQDGAMQALELDIKVRAEANLGLDQISRIEQQLRTAPQGFLGRPDLSDAQTMRANIFSASVTIVGSFTKIIGLLSAPNTASFRNEGFSSTNRIGSPLSPSHNYDSTPPHSPLPHGIFPSGTSNEPTITDAASPVISPVTTPHSGSGMSDDSPNPTSPPLLLDSDADSVVPAAATIAAAGAGRGRRSPNEATTSVDPNVAKQKSLSVRRKFMPKYNVKQRASGTDPGNDGPPDDGHTWRKYGQKDILGSVNPRSYYRCTHKNEMGCPATKYVQRCDDEPLTFDVTYRGNHACQSTQQQYSSWPFSSPPEQLMAMTTAHQLSPPDSSVIGNYPSSRGGSHLAQPSSASQASHEILLSGTSTRHNFSEIRGELSMGGVVASTSATISDHVPSAGPSRIELNSNPSIELGVHHPQEFLARPDDSNPSQQAVFDVSRLSRDTSFERSLFRMLMVNGRTPAQNDLPSSLLHEDLSSHGDLKRARFEHSPIMDQASTLSDANDGQVDKSTQLEYVQRFMEAELGEEIDSDDFHLQLDEQVPVSRSYDSSLSVILDSSGELLNSPTIATEGGRSTIVKELVTLENRAVSLPMEFDLDDMDHFGGSSFHSSGTEFFC